MKAVLTLENPSDELLKAFKSMAKVANVKCKLQHKAKMPAWLKEAKEMSQKPHTYKAYDNVDEMFEDILKWNIKSNTPKSLKRA